MPVKVISGHSVQDVSAAIQKMDKVAQVTLVLPSHARLEKDEITGWDVRIWTDLEGRTRYDVAYEECLACQ